MLHALKVAAPEWYTPRDQEAEAEPAAFLLQGLTGSEQADIAPHLTATGGEFRFTRRGIELLLAYGLKDWRNFVDADGQALRRGDFTPDEIQDMLPYNLQCEIAAQVFTRSSLTADDKKK